MRRLTVAALMLATLGGCAIWPFNHGRRAASASAPVVAPEPANGMVCRPDLLKVLVGRPGSAVLASQALDLSGARTVRWLRPGDMATMDYRLDRVTIKLTRGNIVKSLACG